MSTAAIGWTLSRIAFLGTHAVFAYWLNYLLNDVSVYFLTVP